MTFRTESPVEVETGVFDSLESCRDEAKRLLGEYWANFSAAESNPRYNSMFKFKPKSKYDYTKELRANLEQLNTMCQALHGEIIWDFDKKSEPIQGQLQ